MKITLLLFSLIILLTYVACKKKESPVLNPQQYNSGPTIEQQPDTSVFLTYFSGTRAFNEPIVDKDGVVWIQSDGLGKVSKDGSSSRFSVPSDFGNCYAFDMVIDSHNNKWLCTNNGGLYKFDGTSFTKINKNFGAAIQQKLCIDSQDNLWIGNEYGLYKYDGNTVQHWPWNINIHWVSAMVFDHSGNLWIGCYEGLFKFDGNSFTLYTSQNPVSPTNSVYCIAFDTQGKLWMGNSSYLASLENGVWIRYRDFREGNNSQIVCAINFNSDGIMLIGTQTGLTRFDRITNKYVYEPTLKGYSIRGGAKDEYGNFWYATDDDHGLIKLKAQ